jgi:hypothetical protein
MRFPACDGRLREFSELTTVDEGLQDVLLHIEVIVDDGRKLSAECRKIFGRFVDSVIIDVVAGRLCAQGEVAAMSPFAVRQISTQLAAVVSPAVLRCPHR